MSTLTRNLDLTFRLLVLILAMTVGVFLVIAGAREALAASLKPTAIISSDTFTVGDIFSGLDGDTADKVLGAAPLPGQDMVLNARTLMRIALALDLPWRPAHSLEQVTIRRAATIIEGAPIDDALTTRLRSEGVDGRFEIAYLTAGTPRLVLPADKPAMTEVTALNYDPSSGRFEATLAAPTADMPLTTLTVIGKVERLISVPVLKSTLGNGDIIGAGDITWAEIKHSTLQSDMMLQDTDLIGLTPRRLVAAGTPMRSRELERPQLVSRGAMITIAYRDGPLALTARGKAMQNGAKGDLIRVVNTASNRTVEAFVESQNTVAVLP